MRFDELPEAVQNRVISLAAAALGSATSAQIPPALTAVARFAPAKRAKRGALPLAQAVESDSTFRALVAHVAQGVIRAESDGAPGDRLNGREPVDRNDVTAVTLAYLLRRGIPTDAVGRIREAAGLEAAHLRIAELEREVDGLIATVHRMHSERAGQPGTGDAADEADRLRKRLREQGSRVRDAAEQAARVQADSDLRVAELTGLLAEAVAGRQAAEQRAGESARETERAVRSVALQRESADRAGGARDRRIDLLLSTISAAATGLRREWNLTGQGDLPADVVARQVAPAPVAAQRIADPARLADVLAVPGAHLIVDGYNVTKTGYPDISLADQRDRLIRSLSGLAARTSAEMTVVFDGAAVAAVPPQARKIRVLFSPPGVIADDVIRRLVAAEPAGRPLVVATSDRAVAVDVARAGARTVGSDVLLALVGR